jgi:lipopolysaccharide export system permease protein
MAITEEHFSDVAWPTIKVNKKSGNNGNVLTGITIQKNLILVMEVKL